MAEYLAYQIILQKLKYNTVITRFPNTLWDTLHSYGINYVPSNTTNNGWNSLGFASIYYTQTMLPLQPTQYGQLINIPAANTDESTQLWIEQISGRLYFYLYGCLYPKVLC